MKMKELVDRINASPTMLVKLKFGGSDAPDTLIAKPAVYDEEKNAARVYLYYGPLDPESWSRIRDVNRDEENVAESTYLEGTVVGAFSAYETELDTMPLRELPLWAKELWVKAMETVHPRDRNDALRHFETVDAMKRLVEEEREQGGLNPRDMSGEMQGRYLKLWYSADVLERMRGRGVSEEDLKTLFENVRVLEEVVPSIRELPWRTQKGLDPESMFNREDVYESLVDVLHDAMHSLEMLIQHLMLVRDASEKERRDGRTEGM
jgi:hypothetical protein